MHGFLGYQRKKLAPYLAMKLASQLKFVDFYLPFGDKLAPDKRWVKLAALVP